MASLVPSGVDTVTRTRRSLSQNGNLVFEH